MNSEKLPNSKVLGFRDIIKKALNFKVYYFITIVLFLGVTYFINKYSKTIYQAKASILLSSSNKNPLLGSNDFFKGLEAFQSSKNIENEIRILKSFTLISNVISQLNFEVSYKLEPKSFFKPEVDTYLDFPFRVVTDKSHPQPIGLKIYISLINDSTYRLQASGNRVYYYNYIDNKGAGFKSNVNIDTICKFGVPVSNKYFKFDLTLDDLDNYKRLTSDNRFYFVFNPYDLAAAYYSEILKVEAASSLASIINISIKGENAQKITDFINAYIGFYLDNNLQKKNNVAESTIKFIDSQLSDISDSLHSAESTLRNYKTENQVMDLSFQGKSIYDKLSSLETEKSNLMIQKRYYDYIINYFNNNKNGSDLAPPSTMNVMDPILARLIEELITLNADRSNLPLNNQNNLFLNQIDNQIKQRKESILENVRNNLNTLNISLNELNYRITSLSGQISKLPKTELQLGNIERKFKLNDEIYTFLLEKRSEAQILKSSNTPDYEVIDYSRVSMASIVAPNKKLNMIMAFIFALLIPTAFIILKDYFNDKIMDPDDIERITNAPLIGTIFSNKTKSEIVVIEHPKSAIAESFRSLRTNLQIKGKGITPQVLLLTSSISEEGKSFVSVNIAGSFASFGLKVVLIGFDLRRPVLHEKLDVQNIVGISSYLTGRAVLDDILIKTKYGFDFISSGPILPNPSEILNNAKLDHFFNILKEDYEYIILDTAPLGPIADSYLLMRYATVNIIVARHNVTIKETFINILKNLKSSNMSNINIILNDFNIKNKNYGYDFKYYGEDKKPKGFKRMKWFNKK
jgi:tyrosine-protein kinase Etk/Wzc